MDALKPCPFCGSPARLVEDSDHHGGWFNLGCGSGVPDQGEPCPAHHAFYTCDPSEKANAITAWNTRTPAPSAPVEAVAKERPDRTQELLENASICIRAAMKADNLSDARAMMQAALDFTTNDTEALAEGATYATFQEVGR